MKLNQLICSILLMGAFLISCSGDKMPKELYDQVYQTEADGYPEYLLIKKLSDSTLQYQFFPEDYELSCQLQRKGIAVNQFYKRGPDIVVQEDGSGVNTFRFEADNYKCMLILTTGFADKIKIHGHCNGGNQCPTDAVYFLQRED